MNKYTYFNKKYNYCVFGTGIDPYNGNGAESREASAKRRYPTPNGKTVIADMFAHSKRGVHPRIQATKSDFEKIKCLIKNDKTGKSWYEEIKNRADLYIEKKTDYSNIKFNNYNPQVLADIAFMYRMTENKIYGRETVKYCMAFANMPEWNLKNTIENASVSSILAQGFDWCYDCFSDTERETVKNAIFEKALYLADAVYAADKDNAGGMSLWWPASDHNWNFVCNSGYCISALALTEYDEALCERIITNSLKSLENAFDSFGENGGWDESVAYWKYGVFYLYRLLSAIDGACGTDYGYMKIPCIQKTVLYPVYLQTKNGSFNYGDGTDAVRNISELVYAAKKLKDKGILSLRKDMIKAYNLDVTVEDILFYTPFEYKIESHFGLDEYFDTAETVAFRSDLIGENTRFAALHGGLNFANHGQLDIGTFVFEQDGERWINDLGNDSYSLPGYFERTPWGRRWNYYKNRAEGANTLVINPTSEAEQNPSAKGNIIRFVSEKEAGYTVLDMTNAYSDAKKIYRGMFFLRNKGMILRDEIDLEKPSEIYWFAHTSAEISLLNGGKEAILLKNGKKTAVRINYPQNAVFEIADAESMQDNLKGICGKINDYKKLKIHLCNVKKTNIEITFSSANDTVSSMGDIEKWHIEGEEKKEAIKEILINCMPLADFDYRRTQYYVKIYDIAEAMPKVSVKTSDTCHTEVVDSEDICSPAIITIDKDNKRKSYYIYFVRTGLDYKILSASSDATAILDKSFVTSWTRKNEIDWVVLDMEKEEEISAISLAFKKNTEILTNIEIYAGRADKEEKLIYKANNNPNGTPYEFCTFKKTIARFVKLKFITIGKTGGNDISMIEIYK